MAKAMSHGALLGAGAIPASYCRRSSAAWPRGSTARTSFNGADWAKALEQAAKTAREGLSNPVEGTILTVIRDAAVCGQAVR